ncbi:hypothetical protein CORC01_14423 [Colletotrichum orchidophilum]|uniref:Uncharacterized protein n=1 Tax=Colletotrichum orchidophilum TaxID=1209926 RepID=A0A1G4AM82_9PEZI|nr:uncharacterized protein CORC01_14423 [Colletotrichum orchidophilum]OHE90278.1 hypothetical protein CORC01_14423 [Colletotrichum orchidophilum]
MGSTLDGGLPALDHFTAQLFEESFLDEDELKKREEVVEVAKHKASRKRARVDISSIDPAMSDDTSEDDRTAPNTPDTCRGYSDLGQKAGEECSATVSITAVAALVQEIAKNK